MGIGAACYGLFALRHPDWRWLLWAQVAVVVLISEMAYLSILPDAGLLRAPMDKILHFTLFGAVTFWLNLWLVRPKDPTGFAKHPKGLRFGIVPLAILIPFIIAVLEEGAQHFSPVRTADFADLFSDLSGMIFFWWMSESVLKFRISEKSEPQSPSTT